MWSKSQSFWEYFMFCAFCVGWPFEQLDRAKWSLSAGCDHNSAWKGQYVTLWSWWSWDAWYWYTSWWSNWNRSHICSDKGKTVKILDYLHPLLHYCIYDHLQYKTQKVSLSRTSHLDHVPCRTLGRHFSSRLQSLAGAMQRLAQAY